MIKGLHLITAPLFCPSWNNRVIVTKIYFHFFENQKIISNFATKS